MSLGERSGPVAHRRQGHVLRLPGNGKTIGYTMLYIMVSPTEQAGPGSSCGPLGGRTKNGDDTQANRLATDAMLGSG